jgi:hypothetical protein
VNSHSTVGLVSRQRDAVDWACILCDRRIHNDRASRSASSRQCAYLFYSSRAGSFGKTYHSGLSASLQPRFGYLRLPAFPKDGIAFKREEICECDSPAVHKLSQRRLTADWLDPRESDCWRMPSKVSSDWLPSSRDIQNGWILSGQPSYWGRQKTASLSKHVACFATRETNAAGRRTGLCALCVTQRTYKIKSVFVFYFPRRWQHHRTNDAILYAAIETVTPTRHAYNFYHKRYRSIIAGRNIYLCWTQTWWYDQIQVRYN